MIDTHDMRVEFGKHRGERWTRVPVSYLRWIPLAPLAVLPLIDPL